MHDAARTRVERIAPMHNGPVVPEHHIADPPLMMPSVLFTRCIGPNLIQQRLRIFDRHSHYISVQASPEIKHFPTALRMLADNGMHSANGLTDVRYFFESLAQIAATRLARVVLNRQAFNPLPRPAGSLSSASYMLQKPVSPPTGGTSRA